MSTTVAWGGTSITCRSLTTKTVAAMATTEVCRGSPCACRANGEEIGFQPPDAALVFLPRPSPKTLMHLLCVTDAWSDGRAVRSRGQQRAHHARQRVRGRPGPRVRRCVVASGIGLGSRVACPADWARPA